MNFFSMQRRDFKIINSIETNGMRLKWIRLVQEGMLHTCMNLFLRFQGI